MGMKYFIVLIFLCSCSKQEFMDDSVVYKSVCTDEEYLKVEKQTIFCNEKTSYTSTYCYKSAFQRNCKK